MEAIALRGVRKTYGQHVAVDDLTLTVPAGSIYGFIGPNGSGKSTTLRMIVNIILPDRGDITVLGEREARVARDRISYLPEERGLYKKMKVRKLLRYYGELKGRTRAQIDPAIDEWLARLDLVAWADAKIDQLSKGMAQKVQFMAAVVSSPELVILDEPFSGLDPVNATVLREAVVELRRRGTTVVFSTHDMGAAEKMCDRIFMIYRGKKVLDGTMAEIQAQYGQKRVRVRSSGGVDVLRGLPGVGQVDDLGAQQELDCDGDPQELLRALVARTQVSYFELARPSLHDIFVKIARPEVSHA
jgi:ABC-2 type transport system ATP-binding protein